MSKLVVEKIVRELSKFNPVVTIADTGSIYIKLTGSKVREIRVSNHKGHNLKRNVWEVRSDAMTSRGKFNRVYHVSAINQLIRDFK